MKEDPIFVFDSRAPEWFPAYSDLFRLIEVSGFKLQDVSDIDFVDPKKTYIFPKCTEGIVNAFYSQKIVARVIVWLLETPLVAHTELYRTHDRWDTRPYLQDMPEVWVADVTQAALNPKFKHVFLGGSANLAPIYLEYVREPIVQFYGHFVADRRYRMLEKLAGLGVSVPRHHIYGAEGSKVLGASLIMLHHNAWERSAYSTNMRAMMAASHKMLLVSEAYDDPTPLVHGVHFMMAKEEDLPALVTEVLAWPTQKQNEMRDALWSLFCVDHPFRKNVLDALSV